MKYVSKTKAVLLFCTCLCAAAFFLLPGCDFKVDVIQSDTTRTNFRLIRPNGGESFTAGTTENISWQFGGSNTNTVKLEYWNGSSWKVITEEAENTNSYQWTVPLDTTTQAKVKISVPQSENYDDSDSVFTILSNSSVGTR